ncbi:MAG: NACHT domain-containing protein, partial [Chloroflexota bacterium]
MMIRRNALTVVSGLIALAAASLWFSDEAVFGIETTQYEPLITIITLIITGLSAINSNRRTPIAERDLHIQDRTISGTPDEAIENYLRGQKLKYKREEELFVNLSAKADMDPQLATMNSAISIQDAVNRYDRRFMLVGDPGAGKSMALRKLFLEQADRRLESKDNYIPVWVNLGLSTNPVKVEELLEYWWTEQWSLPGTARQYINQGLVWLFLDGLNEIPLEKRKERVQNVERYIRADKRLPVVVTCRVRDYEDDAKMRLRGLQRVDVVPLNNRNIQQIITRRYLYDRQQRREWANDRLWSEIERNQNLRHLARNPLYLTMLMSVYQTTGTAPESLDRLFGDFVKDLYLRYTDQRKQAGLTPLVRLRFLRMQRQLEKLAFRMLLHNGEVRGTAVPLVWARKQVSTRVWKDGVALGVLVLDNDIVRFYHQALQGHFAIKPLGKALNRRNPISRITSDPEALIRQIADLGALGRPAEAFLIRILTQNEQASLRAKAAIALGEIQ